MRKTTLLLLTLFVGLVLAPALLADGLFTVEGDRLEGRVEEVVLRAPDGTRRVVPRARLATLRLEGDRAFLDLDWLVRTQRLALHRLREGVRADAKTAVYVGRGAFPPSAEALVRRLDAAGTPPRLLFAEDVRADRLAGLGVLYVPGGWAPSMLAALGGEGQAKLRRFVEGGGTYVGICAGAYLPVATVRWEGVNAAWPLALCRGVAEGPVAGTVPWPAAGTVRLAREGGGALQALQAGGCRLDVPGARVRARYPDGSAAVVEVAAGRGTLLLSGAHVEFDPRHDRDLLDADGWASAVRRLDAEAFDLLAPR